MILAIFTLIAWIIISIFTSIKKSFSKIRNIILFFSFNIVIINIFTILTLNLRLLHNSQVPELYFCILLQRNVILPFGLLTYINIAGSTKKHLGSIAAGCLSIVLMAVEILLKKLQIKVYTGWNITSTAIMIIVLIIASNLLARFLNKMLWDGV